MRRCRRRASSWSASSAARWPAPTPTPRRAATCSSSGACSTRSSAGRSKYHTYSYRPLSSAGGRPGRGGGLKSFVQKPVAKTDWPFFFFPRKPSSNLKSVKDDPDS
jgi:hypothetical protein